MKRHWHDEELAEHWSLSFDELTELADRTYANRLGFAVLLKFLIIEGRFPERAAEVPPVAVEYLAEQIGVSPRVFAEYELQGRTAKRDRERVRALSGFRPFGVTDDRAILRHLEQQIPLAREEHVREAALAWCRTQHVEPPTVARLERLAAAAVHTYEQHTYDTVVSRLSAETRASLDALLEPPPEHEETVGFSELAADPGRYSLQSVLRELAKLHRLETVGLPEGLLQGVPAATLTKYRARATTEPLRELRRHPERVRYTLLAAFCWQRHKEILDGLVDLLIGIVHKIGLRAERKVVRVLLQDFRRVRGKDTLLFRLAEAALAKPDGVVREVLFPVAGEQTLADLVREYKASGPAYHQQVHAVLRASYSSHYRRMLPVILDALDFRSNNVVHRPVIKALEVMQELQDSKRRYLSLNDLPIDRVVRPSQRDLVLEEDSRGEVRVNRITYEVSALQALREGLRCKEIWVSGADRYRNPDEDLPGDFEVARERYYELLQQPLVAESFVTDLKQRLTEALAMLDAGMLSNDGVKLTDRGAKRLLVTPLDPLPEPVNLLELKTEVVRRWPMTNLLDVLKEADLRVDFTSAFKTLAQREIEVEAVHIALSGWPAALGMVAHGAPAAHASAERLVRSIVEQLPAEVCKSLPEAAVLEVWSEERASAVGCRLPPGWLRLVRRSGLPLLPLGHDSYRPHQLVIDLLEKLLRQEPSRHRQLHVAAARASKSAGHPLLALKHLQISGNTAEAATLAAEIIPTWERRSQWRLVRSALERLPLEALPPSLQVSLGIALLETGEPNRGEALLAVHRDGPAAPWSCFGLSLAAYRRGALQQTLELVQDGLRQNPDQRALVQLLRIRAVVHSHLGHLEEATLDARECVAQAEKVGDQPLLVQALSIQHFILGRFGQEEAIAIAERSIELARRAGTLHKALPAVDGLFNHYFRLNRAQEVSHLVLELLEEAKAGYPLAIPWMLRNLGYNWLQTGVIAAALPQFNEAVALFERNGDTANAGETLSESIYCLLRLGRVEEAAALLPKLHDLFSEAECQNSAATRLYSEGLVRFYQGRLNEAQELLEQSRNRPQRAHPDGDNIRAVAYLAEIARRQFRLERSHLEELMQLLDRYGSDWLLSLEAEALAALYRFAIAQAWFAERLRPPLLTLAQPVAGQPAQPRPVLKLRLLGEFHATLNGQRLKLSPKERELLTFLALHSRVQRDAIVDALWPELDLKTGRDSLNIHNYRLRAALRVALGPGYSQPIKFDPATSTYVLSNEITLLLDTTELEAAGAAKWRRYGPFLAGCDAEWVAIRRAYYQDLLNRPSA